MTIELLSRPTVYAGGTVPGRPLETPPDDAPETETPPPEDDGEQNPS